MKNDGVTRRRLTISFLTLTLTLALGALSGCSSVPRAPTAQKGIFQKSGEQAGAPATAASFSTEQRGTLPISIPPSISQNSDEGFIWPVREGKVSSFFGSRKRDYHEGIDITTGRGTPIYAAKNGEVIYSSRRIKGYGNMIVVKQDSGMATVYAHNKKNLVRVGDRVTQGQLVGYVGATGKATGPHLHFEVRKGELPQDPLLYLPQVRAPAVAHQ